MRLGRRGDIGFAEAITGTAVVCVVLSAFTVFAVTMVSNHPDSDLTFDWSLTADVTVTEEAFVWEKDLSVSLDKMRLNGLSVTFSSELDCIPSMTRTYGDCEGDVTRICQVQDVRTDDGRRVPTLVTVMLWS